MSYSHFLFAIHNLATVRSMVKSISLRGGAFRGGRSGVLSGGHSVARWVDECVIVLLSRSDLNESNIWREKRSEAILSSKRDRDCRDSRILCKLPAMASSNFA